MPSQRVTTGAIYFTYNNALALVLSRIFNIFNKNGRDSTVL